jgi:hypothetical protein
VAHSEIREDGMQRRIPLGRGLSLGSVLVVAAIAACSSDSAVGPEGRAVAVDATVGSPEIARHLPVDLGQCDSLQAPEGQRFVAKLHARGVQIYRWDGAAWAFVAPSARLYAGNGGRGMVGFHYAGPTWESLGGSKVVGSVMRRCTPNAGAIPWLLLSAASSEGHGIFRGVSYIQRLATVGGMAPARAGTSVGEQVSVAYTADYAFYRKR